MEGPSFVNLKVCAVWFYSMIILATVTQAQSENTNSKMHIAAKHPGTIRMIDDFDKSVRTVRADEVPARQAFVFLDKNGTEVNSQSEANESIPIVEVHMNPIDGSGNLVSKDKAQIIRIQEYGPNNRLLRCTTMVSNKTK